jgi:hypothetical protein
MVLIDTEAWAKKIYLRTGKILPAIFSTIPAQQTDGFLKTHNRISWIAAKIHTHIGE